MYDTKTDSDGFFVFEAIPAGDAHISRQVKLSRWRTRSTHNEQIKIKAGETVIITLGGKGRAVIGQLLPPSSIGSVSWDCANARIGGQQPDPATMSEIYAEIQYPRPERFDEMTVAEVLQWHRDWVKSEEGQALHKEMQRKIEEKYGYSQTKHYSVLIQSDGRFRVDDVEVGRYVLTAMLYEKEKAGRPDYSRPIANVTHEFVIPELAEGDIDVPMELGVIHLEAEKKLAIGEPAPKLVVDGLDGGKIRLHDYTGKFVLINFWNVHMPSAADTEIENIKHIYERFADNKQFQAIGICFGSKTVSFFTDLSKKYVLEKQFQGKQGFLDFNNREIYKAYGIRNFPFTVLVGPDGKVIAAGLEGEELERALIEAIGE
jgi:peroxiredoxin